MSLLNKDWNNLEMIELQLTEHCFPELLMNFQQLRMRLLEKSQKNLEMLLLFEFVVGLMLSHHYQLSFHQFQFLPIYFPPVAPENNDFKESITPFCSVC